MRNLLFVVTHKPFKQVITTNPYKTIIVGNGDFNIDGAWRDNTGDNIADKNNIFCEFSAHYYIWKNQVDNYDNIGLCHYRRYFTKNRFSNNPKFFLNNNDIEKLLSKYDIITCKKLTWKDKNATGKNVFVSGGIF